MIVTGDNTPAHVSDMGAWAPVIPVAVGPYETGGVTGSDAATVLSCSILSGTWTSTFSINSGTTTSTGCPSPDPVSARSTSLENLVALDCAAGCTCNMTPASLPTCIASAAAACPDGSGIGVSAQNASDTAVFGYLQITNPDGTICAYDVTSSWVSP